MVSAVERRLYIYVHCTTHLTSNEVLCYSEFHLEGVIIQTTKEHFVLYVFACGFDFLSIDFLIHALVSLTKDGADGQQFPASIVLNFIFNWRPNRAFKVYLKIIEFEIQN